uniref:uncharacterized protein LOC122601621 n=1 Tax=Erigeron canadensis TaxID=72917 RepID=UPI001CB89483|nr:uncharacterized protein LOC122601621 [Erigeron canadensis]
MGRDMVSLDLKCVYESEQLDYLIDIENGRNEDESDPRFDLDERSIGFVQDIDSPKHIVSMVNNYCVGRVDIVETYSADFNLLSYKLTEFESEFLRGKRISILVLLLIAAIQLKIKSLMNLARNAIVDMNCLKSAYEIFNIFHMPYPTKTSIREILTMDGILESLLRQIDAKKAKAR